MYNNYYYYEIKVVLESDHFEENKYLHQFSTLDFTPTCMILAYLCNSNQLKESFSEDGVDSPCCVLILEDTKRLNALLVTSTGSKLFYLQHVVWLYVVSVKGERYGTAVRSRRIGR